MIRIVTSPSAAARLDAAARFLNQRQSSEEAVIVGASRGAADDLARAIVRRRGAAIGLARFGVTELAARAAAATLAGARRVPGSDAGTDALAARAAFDAMRAGELAYFAPVAEMPGFPRALARTVYELRLAGVTAAGLTRAADSGGGAACGDLARLLARIDEQLEAAAIDDRAAIFDAAREAWTSGRVAWAGLPVVLLDVALNSRAEQAFAAAVLSGAPHALVTIPDGDARTIAACGSLRAEIEHVADTARAESDLAHLRRHLFTADEPPQRTRAGDVRLFSAPGEGREALEIVRRAIEEAAGGVPFDEMAIFLRAPQQYLGLLEHACARAGVPAYFDRGTQRPDPAGRAFIALLSSAVEGLSAKRFDEYLSLGQVPRAGSRRLVPPAPPHDEVFGALVPDAEDVPPDPGFPVAALDTDDEAVVAGTLRAPWKWEELIVESYVVGGRSRADGGRRWRRRLDGLAADYRYRLTEIAREEPDSPRRRAIERDLRNLAHLRAFALPLVDALAEWPDAALWGEWLDRFASIAGRALDQPDRVLRVLADLRPMASVGPVSLEEARDVLRARLIALDRDPPVRRYGRIFVGTPHQARGRAFRVVFVPGLAERIVPQRLREDPLLLDERRRAVDGGLVNQEARGTAERLLLKVAIGAAVERLYLSYPRMDVAETRARVPSFYALDVVRAITGRVPDHRELAAEAEAEGGATLAWPAPADPRRAVDDLEHDLAVLKPLLDSRDPAAVRGRAHYILNLNAALRRSMIARWARAKAAWSAADGVVQPGTGGGRALERHRLASRAYSLSALQRFSACPYQFLLATIHRLEPWEEPEPLMRLDPLTRGSLFHKVQAEFFRECQSKGLLPITHESVATGIHIVEGVLAREAADYEEKLAPANDRIWRDEIGELKRDLGIWVRKLADDREWVPKYFEFSFGLHDEGRDPASLPDPVTVDGGFILHGSVDLIEEHAQLGVLRVTDHKTGKNRSKQDLIVGGGATLQPVLYSVAVEKALGKRVFQGRLYYCTTAGSFGAHPIDINDYTRSQGLDVLKIVDRSIERGWLVAAPAEGACRWCDFRAVCGPREEERLARKNVGDLADLHALRAMR